MACVALETEWPVLVPIPSTSSLPWVPGREKQQPGSVFVVHFIEGPARGYCWWGGPKTLYKKCSYVPKLKSLDEVHIKKLTVFWFCLMVSFLIHMKKQKMLHLKHRILILHYPNLSDVPLVRQNWKLCNSLASTPEWQLLEFWVCLWISWGLLHKEFSILSVTWLEFFFKIILLLLKHICASKYIMFQMWIFSPYICVLYVLAEKMQCLFKPYILLD